jgi:hypothetical protein
MAEEVLYKFMSLNTISISIFFSNDVLLSLVKKTQQMYFLLQSDMHLHAINMTLKIK